MKKLTKDTRLDIILSNGSMDQVVIDGLDYNLEYTSWEINLPRSHKNVHKLCMQNCLPDTLYRIYDGGGQSEYFITKHDNEIYYVPSREIFKSIEQDHADYDVVGRQLWKLLHKGMSYYGALCAIAL